MLSRNIVIDFWWEKNPEPNWKLFARYSDVKDRVIFVRLTKLYFQLSNFISNLPTQTIFHTFD